MQRSTPRTSPRSSTDHALPWPAAEGALPALARQRFFCDGVHPTGQVSDAVWHSWQRCLQSGLQPHQRPEFQPVSRSKANYLAGRDHVLLKAARRPFDELEAMVARSRCKVLLTDRDGVLLRVTPAAHEDGAMLHLACRVGVNLGELLVGTNAPAVSAHTGAHCTVGAHEHFYDRLIGVRCEAAPIRNRHGVVVGALDLSVEDKPFGFDAKWLVQSYAATIENNLRIAQTRQQVLVRLHSSPAALQAPHVGLVAIDDGGRVAWLNPMAAALIGVDSQEARQFRCAELLGCELEQLLADSQRGAPRTLLLPNGLALWSRSEYRDIGDGSDPQDARAALDDRPVRLAAETAARPAAAEPADTLPPAAPAAPAATPASATLAQIGRQLIDQTLAECDGNVSRAARRLGVSRGLLYRRLRQG